MKMHDPPHPGEIILEQCIEPLGLTITAAAKGLEGPVEVTVTVDANKITAVKIKGDKETQGVGSRAVAELPDKIVKANGKLANTGDGQKMGVCIGAQMERGPHAPVSHCMSGPLGDDAFLLVNVRGERFMNEDNDGQHWTNAFERQPQAHAFQIFDAKWREHLACLGIIHGQFYKVGSGGLGGGMSWSAVTTEQRVLGLAKTANTLEELAAKLELPVEAFTATVKRYNELAHRGNDTDYYKRADRLFPVETAPFYGGRAAPSLLVIMGGLVVSGKCEVCDGKFNTIPGLFAAGNAMGCRFSGDYAVTAAGVSHGTALTFGRLAGQMAAKG